MAYKRFQSDEEIKTDATNVNNISFGVFSVDQWRDTVAGISNRQVKHFP